MLKYAGIILVVAALVVVGCGQGGESGEGGNGGGVVKPVSPAVGTWTIDAEALKESVLSQMPPEMREMAGAQVEEQFKNMKLEFIMSEDGTFIAAGDMNGDKFDAKGTWKLEGDQLSISTTWEDGEEKVEPEIKTATLADGKIKIMDEGMPFEMVLIKK